MDAAKTIINEIDQSQVVDTPFKGLAAVSLETIKGPYADASEVIVSWPHFVRVFGTENIAFPGVTQAKRALESGALLRVNKMGHYTTISDPDTLDAALAVIAAHGIDVGTENLFDVSVLNKGAYYNGCTVVISDASNGDSDYFNLELVYPDTDLNELFPNILVYEENALIPTRPTDVESHYLDDLFSSPSFTVAYVDLSGVAGTTQFRPVNGTFAVSGGTDGSSPVAADYVGDSAAKNGFFAFDAYDDFEVIAAIDNTETATIQGGSAYTEAREDCVYFAHLPNTDITAATITAKITTIGQDNRFLAFFVGGLKLNVSTHATVQDVLAIGDIIGKAMASSSEFGEWWSFSGPQRGVISNAVGVVNNFGAAGSTADLDLLANRGVNTVINRDGRIMIWGNFSAQIATSRKSFLNIVKLLIHMKKSLRPTLDNFIEQPNDFQTFREIANSVTPYLDSLVSQEKRALVNYAWKGDQYATQDSDLVINNRTDLDAGKYKVSLEIKEIVSLQILTLNIISAPSGVEFEF